MMLVHKPSVKSCSGVALLLLLSAGWSRGDVFTFDTPAEWQTWYIPEGIVRVTDTGHLELTQYRKDINAVADAHLFVHPSQTRGEVTGGIWKAGSHPATAHRILDGDLETYWKPDPDDQLIDWFVDVDLGRSVLAREIRVTFPDEEGARPFRQFSVFVSTGVRIKAQDDVFRFRQVFLTTKPNEETSIRFPLSAVKDTLRVVDEGLEVDLEREEDYRMVRFVRVVADEKSEAAALAEVEVVAVGDNVSLGTLERGGSFKNGMTAQQPQNLFDGIMDTNGSFIIAGSASKGGWREGGMWWQVDLGALFWIDGIYIYFQDRGEGLSSFLYEGLNHGRGYNILYSDGRRTTTAGDLDLTSLIIETMAIDSPRFQDRQVRHIRYLFAPRKIRYLFWHGHHDMSWYARPMEFMLFSPGYPAQVVMRSNFIDLGQIKGDRRPKAIKSLSWDVDLPPQTKLQLRSRSGNTLEEVYTFYDKKGDVVTEEKWLSSPKVIRGPVDTTIVAGDDWGEWSNFYQFPGERFKSETPRRFIQLELILSTEDPEVASLLRSLSIEFEEALVTEAKGRILPREARPNQDTRFVYTVWPQADAQDSGFDRLRLTIPGTVEVLDVEASIGGQVVVPEEIAVAGDSLLFITLAEGVTDDSVQVGFTARVLRNATLFHAHLGQTDHPDLWQSVEAVERRANLVFLPELAESDELIGDLGIRPSLFTPNGDGVNDAVEIRFALFKVEGSASRVRIFDLSGRLVAELKASSDGDIKVFSWSGKDLAGHLVHPGVYLCHIDAQADAGDDTVVRSIAVSY